MKGKIILIFLISFIALFVPRAYAGNLNCSTTASTGYCPNTTGACTASPGGSCTYTTCDCFVNLSQTIDGNLQYNFKSLTINTSIILTINTNATGGGGGGAGNCNVGSTGSSDSWLYGSLGGTGGTGGDCTGTGGVGGSSNGGGGGGKGGANIGKNGGAGSAGGAGGGYVIFNTTTFINITGSLIANGTNATVGTAGLSHATQGCGGGGGGGGGGGSGGISLISSTVNISGKVNLTGGVGGNGGRGGTTGIGPCSGGVGGNGGRGGMINISATYYYLTGTINITGGGGGTGGWNGDSSVQASNGTVGSNGVIATLITTPKTPANGSNSTQTTQQLNFTVNSSVNTSFPVSVVLDSSIPTGCSFTSYSNGTLQNCTATGLSFGTHSWYVNASTTNGTNYTVYTNSDTWQFTIASPLWSNMGQNVTNGTQVGVGTPISISSNWTDSAVLSMYMISNMTNNSGSWNNGTWTSFSGDTWSNFTVTYPSNVSGGNITFKIYANDSYNFQNVTSTWFWYNSIIPPTYSNNSTNYTVDATTVLHSLNWTDVNGLSGYIFQFCNGTWNGTNCLGLPSNWSSSLSGWSYRKSHNITNATGADVNYTVNITVINATGTDSGNIVYINSTGNSKTRSDFGDIRFTNSTGSLLNYWVEPVNSGANATFWVQVDGNLTSTNQTIYIYYGNSSATTTSNITNTWNFGDDFESNNFNAWTTVQSGWTINSTVAAGGSYSAQGSPNADRILSKTFSSALTSLRIIAYIQVNDSTPDTYAPIEVKDGTTLKYPILIYQNKFQYYDTGWHNYTSTPTVSANAWYRAESDMISGNLNSYANTTNLGTVTTITWTSISSLYYYSPAAAQTHHVLLDSIAVGKYVYPEPSHGIWGNEESATGWVNDTWNNTGFSGTISWSNVTKLVNSTSGATIAWCVYANDTSNSWNGTSCLSPFTYTISAGVSCTSPCVVNGANCLCSQNMTSSFTFNNIQSGVFGPTRSITTSFTISNLNSRTGNLLKSFTNSFAYNNLISGIIGFISTASSYFTINQAITRVGAAIRDITSSLTISQSISRISNIFKSLSQSLTVNIAASRISASLRYISGYFTVNLATVRIQALLKPLSDSLSVSTAITRTLSSLKSITSSFTFNTTISRLGTLIKTVTSYFTNNQSISGLGALFRNVNTSITSNAITGRILSSFKSLSDSFTLSQTIIRTISSLRSISSYFSITSATSRLVTSLRSVTSYFALTQSLSKLSALLRLPTSSFLFSQSVSRIGSLYESTTSYFTITQLSTRLSSVYESMTGYFTFAHSLTRVSEFYKSLSSSFTSNAVMSRIGAFYQSFTSYFSLSQSLSRVSSFLRFLLQLFGLTSTTSSTPSTYNLAITDPTTSNQMTVTSNDNITIAFNFTDLTGQPITSGVNVTNILIGSNGCTVKDSSSYNVTDSLWRVNCTVPTGSGVQDLYLQANATNENILRDSIQSSAIEYSGFRSAIIRLGLIFGQSVQRLASMSTSITSFFSMNLISSRIYSSLRSITGYFTLNQAYSEFLSMTRTFTSSLSFNQLTYRALYFERIFSNSFLYSSSVGLLNAYNRYITGNFILSDSMSRIAELNKLFGESISINLIGTRFMLMNIDLTESLSVTGSFYRLITMTRTLSTGFSLSDMTSRMQFITYVFSQQFSSIASLLGFKPGNLSRIEATLSLSFSNSVQRTITFTRAISEILSINSVLSRALSLIRRFSEFFGIGGTTYGIRPLICSLQSTESNCAFIGGCYWCSGACQASTCTQPSIPPSVSGGSGGGGGGAPPTSVTPEVKTVLDTSVRIETPQVSPGDKVYATVTLMKVSGPEGAINVNISYWMKDYLGNIIGMKQTVVGVETIRSDIYFLTVPLDTPAGAYTFQVLAQYDNTTDTSFDNFQVSSSVPKPSFAIKRVDVPFVLVNQNTSVKVVLENLENRKIDLNVTLLLPYDFIPQNITKSVSLEPLSEDVVEFTFVSKNAGSFTGFINVGYEDKRVIRDFNIEIYSTENFLLFLVVNYWWIIALALIALIAFFIYKTRDRVRRKMKIKYIFKRKDLLP